MTRIRKTAVLIDGGFFLKRIKKWPEIPKSDAAKVADAAEILCRRHIQRLIGERPDAEDSRWLDHVYRLFFYDARPYDGSPHHPILNRQINFARTDEAKFREALFDELRKRRKFALRLGRIKRDGNSWRPHDRQMKDLMKMHRHAGDILSALDGAPPADLAEARRSLAAWSALTADDVQFPLRQKGVDMRIGTDIASMTLKRQVDTIVLVTGDSDFVPAAKVARREGVEFILDPMWQSVESELMEHVDDLASGFDRPVAAALPV